MRKRIFALLLALVMALGLCVTTAWADEVTYHDPTKAAAEQSQTCLDATLITDSSTQWGADSTTTWYVATGPVTINDPVEVKGDVNLILRDGCSLTVNGTVQVSRRGKLTIYGQSGQTGSMTVNGNIDGNSNYGIATWLTDDAFALTINGGIVNANGGTVTGTNSWSVGIYAKELIVNGGTVNAIGGTVEGSSISSRGISVTTTLTVNGGTVNATGGTVTVTNGRTSESGSSSGICIGNDLRFNGGTLMAKTVAGSDDYTTRKAIYCGWHVYLPTTYWWYTAEDGEPVASTYQAYTYNRNDTSTYLKLTTIDPADGTQKPDTPDTEPVSGGHTPIRRQNTTAVTTDTTPADTTKPDTVTSAKTFDAGIAMYVGMSLMSVAGTAVVIGKKKEF